MQPETRQAASDGRPDAGRSGAPSATGHRKLILDPSRGPAASYLPRCLIPPTKKQRACEQLQFACPSSQILRQLYRYSFCPVLGFKNSLPLFLKLLKLNICVIELAIPSKEPSPIRCPPS